MAKKVEKLSELAEGLGFDKAGIDRIEKAVRSRSLSCSLATLRASSGMTQGEMARRLKRSQSSISKLESTPDDLMRIADIRQYAEALGFRLSISVSRPATIAQRIRSTTERLGRLLELFRQYERNDVSIQEAIGKFQSEINGRLLDILFKSLGHSAKLQETTDPPFVSFEEGNGMPTPTHAVALPG